MAKKFTKLAAVAARSCAPTRYRHVILRIDRLVGNSVRGTLGKWGVRRASDIYPMVRENPEFNLNREPSRPERKSSSRPNFGCGSFHTRRGVWSRRRWHPRHNRLGMSAIFFFAPIAFRTVILPIVSTRTLSTVSTAEVEATKGRGGRISVDCGTAHLTSHSGSRHRFEIDPRRRMDCSKVRRSIIGPVTARQGRKYGPFQASDRDGANLDTLVAKEIGMNNLSKMIKVGGGGRGGSSVQTVTAQSQRTSQWSRQRGSSMILVS